MYSLIKGWNLWVYILDIPESDLHTSCHVFFKVAPRRRASLEYSRKIETGTQKTA